MKDNHWEDRDCKQCVWKSVEGHCTVWNCRFLPRKKLLEYFEENPDVEKELTA